MYNIAVCIPTYKRPDMLKKLILSLTKCEIDQSLISNVHIAIIDNDIDFSAERTVEQLKLKQFDTFRLHYFKYPVKGLSNVRNELLRKSIELSSDFTVFIDDDEYPSVQWLNELVICIINNNCDMVVGPVISVFESNVSPSISRWFNRGRHLNNSEINFIITGNLIIKTNSLINYNIWFDNRFNKTGAEDSYFGEQMFKKGAKAYWADEAIVYETVPDSRANMKWLIKRYYNAANTYTLILKLEKQISKLITKLLMSMIYIILGICAFVLILFPFKLRYWGIIKLYEGIGGIAGLLSISYYEYE